MKKGAKSRQPSATQVAALRWLVEGTPHAVAGWSTWPGDCLEIAQERTWHACEARGWVRFTHEVPEAPAAITRILLTEAGRVVARLGYEPRYWTAGMLREQD